MLLPAAPEFVVRRLRPAVGGKEAELLQQHRELFAKLPFVLVGALDGQGRPWAELLAGPPGFVSTPDARTNWPARNPLALLNSAE